MIFSICLIRVSTEKMNARRQNKPPHTTTETLSLSHPFFYVVRFLYRFASYTGKTICVCVCGLMTCFSLCQQPKCKICFLFRGKHAWLSLYSLTVRATDVLCQFAVRRCERAQMLVYKQPWAADRVT